MNEVVVDQDSLKFKAGSNCIISGPSQSGKTTLLYQILKHAKDMFSSEPKQIIYCYGVYQSLYDEMKRAIPHINFFENIPTRDDLEAWNSTEPGPKILILDDVLQRAAKSVDVADLFCQYSHHLNFTTFFLVQNLFGNGKQFRTISLNTHYFIIFAQPRDSIQIQTLGRQIAGFSQVKYFMSAFLKCTESRFGYMLIDVHPQGSPLKFRTNILPDQLTRVFLPEKKQT